MDASQTVPSYAIDLNIDDVIIVSGGQLDADISLSASGESVADIMAGLDGRLVMALSEVPLERSFLTQFGAGFIHNLNPFKKTGETSMLECAVARFDVTDGQVDFDKKVVAKLTDVTWHAGGKIDLKTEKLEASAQPESRKAVSSLTNIGLASLVYVTGTLAEPEVRLNPTDVAIKYAKYTAAIATGGLSWVAEKVFKGVKANSKICEKILKGTEIND